MIALKADVLEIPEAEAAISIQDQNVSSTRRVRGQDAGGFGEVKSRARGPSIRRSCHIENSNLASLPQDHQSLGSGSYRQRSRTENHAEVGERRGLDGEIDLLSEIQNLGCACSDWHMGEKRELEC